MLVNSFCDVDCAVQKFGLFHLPGFKIEGNISYYFGRILFYQNSKKGCSIYITMMKKSKMNA